MSITKRDKNNFRFRVMKSGVNYEMTFYGSEKEAKKAHEEFRLKVKRGEFESSSEDMTLGELWDLYLQSRELEAGTVRSYLVARDSFDFLDKRVCDLDKVFLKKYHNENKRYANDGDFRILRSVLNFGVELDIIASNPLSFRLGTVKRRKYEEVLSLEELKKLIDGILALDNRKYRAFLLIMLFLGTRYGETAGILRENVDTVNHVLHIKQQFKELSGARGLGKLKTDYSERDLLILEVVRPFLYELVLATPSGGLVFQSSGKYPIMHNAINNQLKRLCVSLGIPVISTHKLRKLAASMAIYSAVDPVSVSKMLGHSTINMTEHYLLSMSEMRKAQAEKMDKFVRDLT